MASYPIIEINTEDDARKDRRIVLHKAPMSNEIDAHTSKFVEAGDGQSVRRDNAISSDSDETLDGSILEQMMRYRDAELRKILEAFLQEEEVYVVDNLVHLEPIFVYNLSLPEDFNDANLGSLATLMHKYIVWGCLFDWYAQLGSAQARAYGSQLEDLEEEIKSMTSPAGYAKRPLQPFGPAERI